MSYIWKYISSHDGIYKNSTTNPAWLNDSGSIKFLAPDAYAHQGNYRGFYTITPTPPETPTTSIDADITGQYYFGPGTYTNNFYRYSVSHSALSAPIYVYNQDCEYLYTTNVGLVNGVNWASAHIESLVEISTSVLAIKRTDNKLFTYAINEPLGKAVNSINMAEGEGGLRSFKKYHSTGYFDSDYGKYFGNLTGATKLSSTPDLPGFATDRIIVFDDFKSASRHGWKYNYTSHVLSTFSGSEYHTLDITDSITIDDITISGTGLQVSNFTSSGDYHVLGSALGEIFVHNGVEYDKIVSVADWRTNNCPLWQSFVASGVSGSSFHVGNLWYIDSKTIYILTPDYSGEKDYSLWQYYTGGEMSVGSNYVNASKTNRKQSWRSSA